jgi:Kelch motif
MAGIAFTGMRQSTLWIGVFMLACASPQPLQSERSPSEVLEASFPKTAQLLEHARRNPIATGNNGYTLRPSSPPQRDGSPERWRAGHAGVEAQLPSSGAADFRISTANASLLVRRVGAGTSAAKLADGLLVYPNVWANVDAYVFATPGGMEELLVARDEAHPAYEVALPPSWGLRNAPGLPGLVEVLDAFGAAKMRVWAGRAWEVGGREVACRTPVSGNRIQVLCDGKAPLAIDPEWQSTTTLPLPMQYPTATQLPTGKVLIAGGDVSDAGLWAEYDPMAGAFTAAGAMHHPRWRHTATLLKDGRVLVTGGYEVEAATASAELYDPMTRSWTETGSMNDARWKHTATRLESGQVLVTGGAGVGSVLSSAELFDPASGEFTPVEDLDAPRVEHVATALSDGDILITGGMNEGRQALRYRPATGHFEAAAMMSRPRKNHTATVLPDGRVLLAGGNDHLSETDDVEIYDPSANQFAPASKMSVRRSEHRATVLPSGKVLITGGESAGLAVETAESFDPRSGRWEAAEPMTLPRAAHAALLLPTGKVLVTGGTTAAGASVTSELFDAGESATSLLGSMFAPRYRPRATSLPSGDVLVSGGGNQDATPPDAELCDASRGCRRAARPLYGTVYSKATQLPSGDVVFTGGWKLDQNSCSDAVEIFRYPTSTFESPTALLVPRTEHTASLLPDGRVLIAGGTDNEHVFNTASILDPTTGEIVETSPMAKRRRSHTATPTNGRVLIAGGLGGDVWAFSSLESYDPNEGSFSSAGQLSAPRYYHTATEVGGRVLFIGGVNEEASTDLIERYDPATQSTEIIGRIHHKRWFHTATLLASGKVLVVGGFDAEYLTDWVSTAELVDPETGVSEIVGPLVQHRPLCSVVALQNGDALLLGGLVGTASLRSLEVYDAASKSFSSPTGFLGSPRTDSSSELLPDGTILFAGGSPGSDEARVVDPVAASSILVGSLPRAAGGSKTTLLDDRYVLFAGGANNAVAIESAEVYDIEQRSFSTVGPMSSKRQWHASTRLPSGNVLVTGGLDDGYHTLDSAEQYVPASGQFEAVGAMHHPRYDHTSVLLPSGKVLVVGGKVDGTSVPVPAEIFDPGTGLFEPYEAVNQGGRLRAVPTASGDPLIAGDLPKMAGGSGDGTAFRIRLGSGTLQFFADTPASPTALLPRVNGETLVCGAFRCARLDMGVPTPWSSMETVETVTWSGAFELPTNDTFMTGSQAGESVVVWNRRVDNISTPTVEQVQLDTLKGEPELTLLGSRFASSTMAGTHTLPAVSPPVVVFRAAGHATVPMRVGSWSNTSITATCPATVYHGPGWVHVIVDGVPSDGRFLVLPPSSNGASCAFDAHCGSGHCVDGVCCDDSCEGPCVTCLGAHRSGGGQDGVCGAVAVGLDPRDACERAAEDTCGQNGECDGAGTCAIHADGTTCRTEGRCESGTCLRCNEAKDAVLAGDSTVSCSPYGCRDGACVESCASQAECAPGHVCGADGECGSFRAAPIPTDPGACSAASVPTSSKRPWLSVAFLLCLAVVRSKQRKAC